MNKSYAFLVAVSTILIIAICFVAMPFIFIGSPSPFFTIDNKDVNEYNVVIEMFDSTNKSVFKETYELAPEERFYQSKPTWLLLKLSIPPWNKEEYIVKITLNDNFTKTSRIEVEVWSTLDIKIYGYDAEYPVSMGINTA